MGQNQYTRKCIEFVAFLEQNKCKFINLIHTRQQWEMLRLCSWKREIKSFENITQHQKMKTYLISQKIICARTHQKHIPGSSIDTLVSIDKINERNLKTAFKYWRNIEWVNSKVCFGTVSPGLSVPL